VTLVDLSDKAATTKVMISYPSGPQMRPAGLVHLGSTAPMPRKLPQGVADDAPIAQKSELVRFRLTAVREFADQALITKAMRYPQCLPSLVLDAARQRRVICTKAALAYEDEATCLVEVAKPHAEDILGAKLPPGVFLMKQRDPATPQWLRRAPDMPSDRYWAQAVEQATALKARLVFRPKSQMSIGLVGAAQFSSQAALPRWYLHGSPLTWDTKDVEQWVGQRGFTQASSIERRGRSAWTLLALAPASAAGIDTFTFASGMTIAPAVGRKRREETAKSAAKHRWGAADVPAAGVGKPASRAVGVPRPAGFAEAGPTGAPAASEGAAAEPASQRRRVELGAMPFSESFENIDCGGEGDCGFLAFGRATHDRQSPDKKAKVSLDDFKPKGPVQAELRLLAAKELEKNHDKYLFTTAADAKAYASKVGKAGFYADSRSMYALAQAAQVDLRIYAWSEDFQRWTLYRFIPHTVKKKSAMLPSVWLRLKDMHYTWLKPTKDFTAEMDVEAIAGARTKLDHLSGAGRRGLLQSIGIDAASCRSTARSGTSRGAPSRGRGGRRADILAAMGIETQSGASEHEPQHSAVLAAAVSGPASAPVVDAASHIAAVASDSLADMLPYVAGSMWTCPCGWRPVADTSGKRRTLAERHWKQCQGRAAPEQSLDARRAAGAFSPAAGTAAHAAKARVAHAAWLSELAQRAPEAVAATCTPNLDVPFTGTCCGGTKACLRYKCTKCGEERLLGVFRRLPCKKRPRPAQGGLSDFAWRAAVWGNAAAVKKAQGDSRAQKARVRARRAARQSAQSVRKRPAAAMESAAR
jgi:hypothetical protein